MGALHSTFTFWLWIHLKTDRRFIDLLRPLMLTERQLMSRFSIVFVLKGVCKCVTANLKRETILTAFFRPAGLGQFAYFGVKTYFCEMKMGKIKGKQT